MQKWNISTYRAQRVDEKNDVIFLVMFTFKVMVIRLWQMAYFSDRPSLGKMIFHVNLKILPKVWQIFCCSPEKIKKVAISDILKPITLEVSIITRQMTSFFSSIRWGLSFGLFHFKAFKIQFNGIPHFH